MTNYNLIIRMLEKAPIILLILFFSVLFPFAAYADYDPVEEDIILVDDSQTKDINIALVLSDIVSNKDLEFTRGFITGVERVNATDDVNVTLKVLNGQTPEDSLYNELMSFEPIMIISTFEKNSPSAISRYLNDIPVILVNAFDAKGRDFITMPHLFQFLTPSDTYNQLVGNYIIQKFEGNSLIVVGEPDDSDQVLETVIAGFSGETPNMKAEELENLELEPFKNYLFYVSTNNKNDIKEYLNIISKIKEDNSSNEVNIIGRSNWIAMSDLVPEFSRLDVYIPTKCYFDPSTLDSKLFIETYNSMYGHNPVKSFPVYSVAGYDIASYFIPAFISARLNDSELELPQEEGLQTFFNFMRANDDGGYLNQSAYLIQLMEHGYANKTLIKDIKQ